MKSTSNSFIHKLSIAFLASISIFLVAATLTWYLIQQLENAVEVSINETLPESMIAMRLSESSAELLTAAPELLNATNQSQTNAIASKLDRLQTNIIDNVNQIENYNYANQHTQPGIKIRLIVNTLVGNLISLKLLADNEILLKQQLSKTLFQVQQVNNDLLDTLSPVVWGVSSLSRLSAKRTIRQNQAAIEKLQNQQLPLLRLLEEVQTLFFKLKSQANLASPSLLSQFEKKITLLRSSNGLSPPLLNVAEQALIVVKNTPMNISAQLCQDFDQQFKRALTNQKNQINLELSNNSHLTELSISNLVEETNLDIAYTLDIKAEGNLLFALLSSLPDIDNEEKILSIQRRFKSSYNTFHQAVHAFNQSRLSQRNPILSQSIADIDNRLNLLDEGNDSLFNLRLKQIQNHHDISLLLASNNDVVTKLKEHVQLLLKHIQNDADILSKKLTTMKTFHVKVLVIVFLALFIIFLFIAYITIRIFSRHERELSQAATVFNNTAEGIVITAPNSTIIAVNQAFSEISGYSPNEVMGKNIKMLKSGRHREAFYQEMWQKISSTGRWQGEIYNRKKNGDIYPEWLTINAIYDHKNEVCQYVAIFSDISLLKKSLAEMDHLANHDALTGLPNRLLFNDRLKHALTRAQRDQQQIAVLFLDLDHFKSVNDNLGHKIGDELLCHVAKRLKAPLREVDTIARLGGDEFTIIMENISGKQDATITAKKILAAFKTPFHIKEHCFSMTTSIGISLFPEHANTGEVLVENADMAMYLAKHTGKNNFQFYTSDLDIHKSLESQKPEKNNNA